MRSNWQGAPRFNFNRIHKHTRTRLTFVALTYLVEKVCRAKATVKALAIPRHIMSCSRTHPSKAPSTAILGRMNCQWQGSNKAYLGHERVLRSQMRVATAANVDTWLFQKLLEQPPHLGGLSSRGSASTNVAAEQHNCCYVLVRGDAFAVMEIARKNAQPPRLRENKSANGCNRRVNKSSRYG